MKDIEYDGFTEALGELVDEFAGLQIKILNSDAPHGDKEIAIAHVKIILARHLGLTCESQPKNIDCKDN